MRVITKGFFAFAILGALSVGQARADSNGIVDAMGIDVERLSTEPSGVMVVTAPRNPTVVRLERAALQNRSIRSLSIAPTYGKPIQLRDVKVSGWSATSETAVEITLRYERVDL